MTELDQEIVQRIQEMITEGLHDETEIYHYTTAEGICSILSTGELWLTNSQFMNDMTEIETTDRLIREVLLTIEVAPYTVEYFLRSIEDERKQLHDQTFVLSLSKNPDSLHLWNNYGKNEGYQIGFKFVELARFFQELPAVSVNGVTLSSPFSATPGNVIYDDERKRELLRYPILKYVELTRETEKETNPDRKLALRNSLRWIWRALIKTTYLFKQDGHGTEEEVRIVVMLADDSPRSFRTRNGVVVPYVKLESPKRILPIGSIKVGPKIDDAIAILGLTQLLKNDYRTIVPTVSKYKLRF